MRFFPWQEPQPVPWPSCLSSSTGQGPEREASLGPCDHSNETFFPWTATLKSPPCQLPCSFPVASRAGESTHMDHQAEWTSTDNPGNQVSSLVVDLSSYLIKCDGAHTLEKRSFWLNCKTLDLCFHHPNATVLSRGLFSTPYLLREQLSICTEPALYSQKIVNIQAALICRIIYL